MSKFPSSASNYEKVVQEIYQELLKKEGINSIVKHNIKIKGKTSSHQIDVYWAFELAGMKIQVIVDCKNYSRRVEKIHVTNLKSILDDIGAQKGVIVTTVGYQKGAIEFAKGHGIDLKIVRSPKDIDWDGYIRVIKVNLVGIGKEYVDYKIKLDRSSYICPQELEKLIQSKQLNFIIDSEFKLYNMDGSLYIQSFKGFLEKHSQTSDLKDTEKLDTSKIYSNLVFPEAIFIKVKTPDDKEILLRTESIEIFYKFTLTRSSIEVDAASTVKAVLQDHKTSKIEHMLRSGNISTLLNK